MTYWRASGYFSSGVFEMLGESLGNFVLREGKMLLVTSIHLSEGDKKAIEEGTISLSSTVNTRLKQVILEEFRAPLPEGTKILTNMLKLGALEIKVATRSDGGLYHEKLGVFFEEKVETPTPKSNFDYDSPDSVTFSGSQNETRAANIRNYESIDVFTSWQDSRRAKKKRDHFRRLWSGNVPSIVTFVLFLMFFFMCIAC